MELEGIVNLLPRLHHHRFRMSFHYWSKDPSYILLLTLRLTHRNANQTNDMCGEQGLLQYFDMLQVCFQCTHLKIQTTNALKVNTSMQFHHWLLSLLVLRSDSRRQAQQFVIRLNGYWFKRENWQLIREWMSAYRIIGWRSSEPQYETWWAQLLCMMKVWA